MELLYRGFEKISLPLVNSKYWQVKAVLLSVGLAFFFAMPLYDYIGLALQDIYWSAFEMKVDHLFSQPYPDELGSHAAKMTFRLTVPLVAKIFHLTPKMVLVFQFFIGILFLIAFLKLVFTITGDKIVSVALLLSAVFVYFGKAAFLDHYTWFDGWAYFLLIMAMMSSRSYLIFAFSFLAAWTDERAFLALGLIFIWWKLKEEGIDKLSFKSLAHLKLNSSAVLLAGMLYLLGRWLLSSFYGLHTPTGGVGLGVLANQIRLLGIGFWTFFEGLWLLVLAGLLFLITQRNWFLFGYLILMILTLTAVAFSVYDITRSGSYLFPAVLIALQLLKSGLSKKGLGELSVVCLVICFLFPAYNIISVWEMGAMWYKPLILYLLEHWH